MNIIPDLIFNVGILFVMLIPGIILKKCMLVPDGFGKGIANLVLYVAQPLLIVSAYINCSSRFADIWVNVLAVFILSVVAHALFSVVSLFLFKKSPDNQKRMLRFVTIFANAAFMGIPLIEAICGAEAAIYASIYNITFNLFLWTLGVQLCTYEEGVDHDGDGDADLDDATISYKKATKGESSLIKVLLHPVTLASLIGFILLATGLNTAIVDTIASAEPNIAVDFIVRCINMLKALVAPLSMIIIGLRLAEIDFHGMWSDLNMYKFLALRHFILPLTLVGIIKLLVLIGVPISDTATVVTVILAATPAASSATMFAEKYDCDAAYVSRLVAVSTVLSIVSMPLVCMLAGI